MDTLKCAPWVEDILENGYKIPFNSLPGHYDEPNNASVLQNQSKAVEIVLELQRQKIVEFTDQKPHCVSPLGLVTRLVDGELKERLVFDASRWINLHTTPPAVKLVHLSRAIQMTHRGDFQAIFDLRSAYYHIKINENHTKYLGAAIMIEGKRQFFVFKHLPFGLNSAVHAITKIWKPMLAYLHKEGIRISIYIDDGRILASNAQLAEESRIKVYDTLKKAGWHIAKNKSDSENEASTVKKYLGFLINSKEMTVSYPESKLDEVLKKINTPTKIFGGSKTICKSFR